MRKILILILFAFSGHSATSQVASEYYQSAGEKAVKEYLDAKGQNLSIYNGIQHAAYLPSIKGLAYYKSDAWQKGSVFYEGILYKEVFLKYDMVKDELIVQNPGSLGIILFSPRVSYFSFPNSVFVYKDKSAKPIPEGFYEQLVEGKISLLIKRKVIIEEKIIFFTELNREFLRNDQYYVQKDGKYYAIKNEKTLLNLLGDQKREFQKYLKKNKIKFKRNPEYTLLKIAEQYNQAKD